MRDTRGFFFPLGTTTTFGDCAETFPRPDAEGKAKDGEKLPSGHMGFVIYHPKHGRCYASAPVPENIIRLFETLKERDTYICQFELIAAIMPFLSVPEEWFTGYPVELWIDNSSFEQLFSGHQQNTQTSETSNIFI